MLRVACPPAAGHAHPEIVWGAHRLPGDLGEVPVLRVDLAEDHVTLVLHGPRGEWPTFTRLDVHDVADSLPHWLHPGSDTAGFYAAWRAAMPYLWAEMAHLEVHVFPRGAITPEWWVAHYCDADLATYRDNPFPGALAFRAFAVAARRRVVLIADAAETPESFGWLLCHELAHVAFAQAPFLRAGFAAERMRRGIPAEADARYDDTTHDQDPEEQAANATATALMGATYDRRWWRARLGTVRMTLTHRVPAGVPAVFPLYAGATSDEA